MHLVVKRSLRAAATALGTVLVLGVVGGACLTRPVETSNPNLKTNFTSSLHNKSVDKLDILFMVDNSQSMGDKQSLLAAAVPDMIARLVTPNCVSQTGAVVGQSDPATGACATGKPEFPPVHDMHIGIVTSSLGGRGAQECLASDTNAAMPGLNSHNDDRGELINRGGDAMETPVPMAQGQGFLAWYPTTGANTGKRAPAGINPEVTVGAAGQAGTLIGDFANMISGVHEHGCGFEATNEAWYRFLVQPDPFDHITVTNSQATEDGIDGAIISQRAAFLRPDSLLAIIVVTDENEEVANPLSVGGQGWLYEGPWPGGTGAAEGTVECKNAGPNDPACTSCAFSSVQGSTFTARCPPDPPGGTMGNLDLSNDSINVRFFDQKRRFGVFVGYPTTRYTRGMMSTTVPDRSHEVSGGVYVGDQDQFANCVNPIFAQNLPKTVPADPTQLCNLQPGPRTPDLVYYAAIAGVPHQLLQAKPGDPECPANTNQADCPQKDQLADTDWLKITGADPDNYNYSGADPHMVESEDPRIALPPAAGGVAITCDPAKADNCDPINGREWNTQKNDLQFACIFPIVNAQTGMPQPKDCTLMQYSGACDCFDGTTANPFNKPLCAKDQAGKYTAMQIYGKAYPSVREMTIAHRMATQGIVSSLCPIHTSQSGPTDPLYGYRPAVNAIVNRLKNALSTQCLPQKLNVQADGTVPCLLLASFPANAMGQNYCDKTQNGGIPGLSPPDPGVLARFQGPAIAAWTKLGSDPATDPRKQPVCQLTQIGADMANQVCVSGGVGWCYVEGGAGGGCPQQILFTANQPPQGAIVSLQCIEQANGVIDGGAM
jgi:hypothetical protein